MKVSIPEYLAERQITKVAFAEEMQVSVNALNKWIKGGGLVVGDDLVSPKRKVKPLGYTAPLSTR